MLLKYVIPIVVLLATATTTRSFTIAPSQQSFGPMQTAKWHLPKSHRHQRTTNTAIYSSAPDQEQEATETEVPISSMRVKEIQAALKELNVDSSDCFDKESLVKRLQEARENPPVASTKPTSSEKDDSSSDETSTSSSETTTASESSSSSSDTSTATPKTTTKTDFDKDAKLVELRAMRVRELREACAKRQIRWGQFIEKEDLVQALIASMEASADFSLSGGMTAGEVTDLTGEQLEQELSQRSEAPLLLDIYATWCGPCQMMAPQLKEAAAVLGDRVRVGKIDSDKYPAMAQKLKAAGLPTVLVLNGNEELQRIEGALMKDQILQFVDPYI